MNEEKKKESMRREKWIVPLESLAPCYCCHQTLSCEVLVAAQDNFDFYFTFSISFQK